MKLDELNPNVVEVLKQRQMFVKAIEANEKALKQVDTWLEENFLPELDYGTHRWNTEQIHIKVEKKKDIPTISSTVSNEKVQEIHTRIEAKEPFVKYKPDLIIGVYNRLTTTEKNAISDVVTLRKQKVSIEVV